MTVVEYVRVMAEIADLVIEARAVVVEYDAAVRALAESAGPGTPPSGEGPNAGVRHEPASYTSRACARIQANGGQVKDVDDPR